MVALPVDAQPHQEWRVGVDTQVSLRSRQDGLPSTGLVIDSFIAAQWGERTQLIARPVSRGRLDGGWYHDLYQAGIRYQPPIGLPLRLEAGYALPVIGLGLRRSRPLERDTGSLDLQYVTPLPPFEMGLPTVYPITPSYPLVAIASLGTSRWDLRLGVADGSPTRLRGVTRNNDSPRAPQLVVGGGVTPTTGLRIGATFVTGDYVRAAENPNPTGESGSQTGGAPAGYLSYAEATFHATADHHVVPTYGDSETQETVSATGGNRRATVSGVGSSTSSATRQSRPSGSETCSRRPRGAPSRRMASFESHMRCRRVGASPADTMWPRRPMSPGCSPPTWAP